MTSFFNYKSHPLSSLNYEACVDFNLIFDAPNICLNKKLKYVHILHIILYNTVFLNLNSVFSNMRVMSQNAV